jgi:hypothetical protein
MCAWKEEKMSRIIDVPFDVIPRTPWEQELHAQRIVEQARRDVLRAEAEEAHSRRERSLVAELARAFPDSIERKIDMANDVPRYLQKSYTPERSEEAETESVLAELRKAYPDRHELKAAKPRTEDAQSQTDNPWHVQGTGARVFGGRR